MKAIERPIIDGDIIQDWRGWLGDVPAMFSFWLSEKDRKIDKKWSGPKDLSGYLKFVWQDEGLYMMADIKDDKVYNKASGSSLWMGDSVHLCIETKYDSNNKRKEVGQYHYQFEFSPTNESGIPEAFVLNMKRAGAPAVHFVSKIREDGYQMEIFFPKEAFFFWKPKVGDKMLFDIYVIDNDGKGIESTYVWSNGNSWADRSVMGEVDLVKYEPWQEEGY